MVSRLAPRAAVEISPTGTDLSGDPFPEEPSLNGVGLAAPVIDLHCHVLRGIDDGPRTIQDSLAVAVAAASAGSRTLVATIACELGVPQPRRHARAPRR
jgi:hypothetical protein